MDVKLYMKSGNVITITQLEDVKIKYIGNEITAFDVVWAESKPGHGVMIGSIALDQIEAVETI